MPDSTKSKNKTIEIPSALVIGGAGFIGSYICESLLAQNLHVVAIDDLSTGQESYLESLKKDKNFEFIKADINISPLPEMSNIKYVFHIGGIESYINGIDLSLKTMLVNSIGTYNILELARKNNAQVLLASSLDIYGGALSSLTMKNYFGQSDRDSKKYTHHEAKRYAEALVTEYYRKFELDARIVRLADVYGPRMDLNSGTEIAQLFYEAINTDSLTIHGDGLKVVHPTFVSDVVTGITKAMFTANTKGKIYNITTHDEINVLNFAYTIQKNSTKPLKIQFTQEYKEIKFPLHPAEIQQTESDLAWNARTKLPEGVTQTLEYFFLTQPKATPTKKAAPVQTENMFNTNTLLVENMTSKEIKPLPHSEDLTIMLNSQKSKSTISHEDNVAPSKKVNKWNALILATSLFIVLSLFIFPLYTLYSSNDKSINATYESLSQESMESAINAQKNIYFGNVQYDNLEWFFNTVQKRSAFENSRTSLQALDKLNTAIATQNKVKSDAVDIVSALLNGTASTLQVEKVKRGITSNFLNIQNAVIENQTAIERRSSGDSELLFTQNSTSKLEEILKRSAPLLSKYEKESSLIQNITHFLSPPQNKSYMIIFQDTLFPNKYDSKVIGYAYIQINKNGITKMSVNQYIYINEKNTVSDVSKDILEINKSSGWLPLNAIFTANTTMLKNLVTAQGSVTAPNLAQIISTNDVEEKLLENRANNEFQYTVWKEGVTKISSLGDANLTKVGYALYKGILHEDIKMLVQDLNGTISPPLCDIDRILQRDFTDTDQSVYPNKNNGNPYCISLQEKQLSFQKNKDTQKNIDVTISALNESTSHFKITYQIKNNSKTTVSSDIELTLSDSPQLTNIEFQFPLALDKARQEKKDAGVSYTVNTAVEPGATKELIIEWNAKKTSADLNTSGVYISKPFGTVIEQITASHKTTRTRSNSSQNTDLYLH
ncbi:MAG: NAD-dependent epimerase/dehydratase family protein [bacterium]|nr:NAD-dependent epimerase/dehydratase family protein [bacterium]